MKKIKIVILAVGVVGIFGLLSPAEGAFPNIDSTATTNVNATTTPAINLPASISSGNTIVVFVRSAVAGDVVWPVGWTELFDSVADASDDQTAAAWRKADGTEGATINISTGNGKVAALSWNVSGAADPSVMPPQISIIATGNSLNPNSTSLSPAAGTADYLWLTIAGWEGEQTSPPTYPVNYVLNQITANSGTGGQIATNVQVAGAGRQLNSSSDDPGSYAISSADDWTAVTLVLYPILDATIEQSGFRWFRNIESPDLISFGYNPSTSSETAYGIALDKSAELLYVVGNDASFGDSDRGWRLARRDAKTGHMDYATSTNISSGADEPRDIVIDSNGENIYIAGFDSAGNGREWRIESRRARTGELNYAVSSDPSAMGDEAHSLVIDTAAEYMYVVGSDGAGGTDGWRIEKRATATGNLEYAISENYSTSSDIAHDIALDEANGHMYVVGQSALASGDMQWRIEKRNLSDGSLVFATTTNPSSGEDSAEAIVVATSSLIIAGQDRTPGDRQWRIERRDLSGVLMQAVTTNPSGGQDFVNDMVMQNNGTRVYIVGEESGTWRIEKRLTADLSLQNAFDTDGIVVSDPSTNNDIAYAAAFDGTDNRIYVAGQDMIPGDAEWRVERRDTSDGNPTWGNALGGTNASSTFPPKKTAVRLRMLTHISNGALASSTENFKLQYATKSGACDTGFSGETYADVATSTGDIRYFINGLTNGIRALANFRDPTHTGHTVTGQKYVSEGTFTNPVSIPAGEDGLWDFALQNYSAPAGNSYCFRIVKSDNSLLNTYSFIPEITTSASLVSFDDQVFEFGQATTTAAAITVAGSTGSSTITAANDIRIKIDTADAKMIWDTTQTNPSISGVAASKVSGTVSYPDDHTLLVDVTTDFAAGESITLSGLGFGGFTDVSAETGVLKLFVGGSSDSDDDDINDRGITITGRFLQDAHSAGELENNFDASGASFSGPLFGFKLLAQGEVADISTTTIEMQLRGFTASDISNAKLYWDKNGDRVIDGGDVQLGTTGVVSVPNGAGTIVFSDLGISTTTRDMLLVADITSIDDEDYIRFSLVPSNMFMRGRTSQRLVNPRGSALFKNHGRPGRSGGGGGGAVDGGPPSGGGSAGGGSAGGGGGGEGDPGGGGGTGGGDDGGGGGGEAP